MWVQQATPTVLVLLPSEHATAWAGRGHSEHFSRKNRKLCCILFVFFLKLFSLVTNFVFVFFSSSTSSSFLLSLSTLTHSTYTGAPRVKGSSWTQDFPGYWLWPVVTTPPTPSSSPSLTPAALFADNWIVKAANGQPRGKQGKQS